MNKKIRGLGPLFITSTIIVILILLPTFTLLKELLTSQSENWEHIKSFLLKDYILNSIKLVFSVGLITALIGTFFSWMLTQYKFKGHGIIFALLILPLAIPPYIAGYVYGGIFNYGGTLERIMRSFNLEPIHIDILSMNGAIFVFSLFLMPYVVLITRSFFYKLPSSYFESSKLLGKSASHTFLKVILPLSRSAIIGGSILVILEVLNDYGLVKYFGITTFSTAIYKTWFGLGDVSSAIRLASLLMVFVFILLTSEQLLRGRVRISQPRALAKMNRKKSAPMPIKIVFYILFSTYVLMSTIIPILQLIQWSFFAKSTLSLSGLSQVVLNTLKLSLTVTLFVIISSLIIGNFARLKHNFISKLYARIVILGYSIPASIIAVAVMTFFITTDRLLRPMYQLLGFKNLFLTGSLVMLTFALVIRFMAIGFNSIESGYKKIGIRYFEASKLLGKSNIKTFMKVDLPLLKPALISAIILTFVDVLKELPLTLILRPFNYNTLATQVYTYAGDEMIHEASVYALMIIAMSAITLIALQFIQKERKHD